MENNALLTATPEEYNSSFLLTDGADAITFRFNAQKTLIDLRDNETDDYTEDLEACDFFGATRIVFDKFILSYKHRLKRFFTHLFYGWK